MSFASIRNRALGPCLAAFGAVSNSFLSVIGRRLMVMIILFSSIITLLLTIIELSLVYRHDLDEIDKRLGQVELTYVSSITNDVWELNWTPLEQTLRGIVHLPDIEYVGVISDTGHRIEYGSKPSEDLVNREHRLYHDETEIGRIEIAATTRHVRERVMQRIGITLLSNGIKTFLVSLFALVAIRLLITRRLYRLSDYSQCINLSRRSDDAGRLLTDFPEKPDELDQVERALGDMVRRAREAYRGLEQSERRFRELVESALEAMVVLDAGQVLFVNAAAVEIFGAKHKLELVGLDPARFVDAGSRTQVQRHLQRVFRGNSLRQFELPLRRVDGSVFNAELSAVPIRFDKRDAAQIVFRDITERKQTEDRLRQSAAVFESSLEGVFITDVDGVIVDANGALCEMTGYSYPELLGKNPRLWRSEQHDDRFYQEMWQSLLDCDRWRGEIWNRRKDGEQFPAWLTASAVRDNDGRLTHYVALLTDISVLKDAEEKLLHLAHYDSLTDLPNRVLFSDRVNHAIARAGRNGKLLSMLFIDLDNFKNINDSFGHPTGDVLLRLAAERLRDCVRSDSTLARIGGDEFTLLLEDVEHIDDAALVADRVLAAFSDSFQLENRELFISPSIGISLYPQDGTDTDALLRNADAAMYQAKRQGRNSYAFYTRQLTTHVQQKVELEQRLRQALKLDEFELYYQPQIDLASGQLVGAEALLRWHYSSDEMMLPSRFIPLSEDNGMILPIGEWLLETACRQAVAWLAAGLPVNRMAVNISATQINRSKFTEMVEHMLDASGLPPQNLELEVTEGSFIGQRRYLEDDLRRLRELGVRIAIDDFGTGYSSMAQLKHLNVDRIKIDRSFVQDIPLDSYDCAIVTALTSMGKGLGLGMVAEGIETEEQRRFLLRQGCKHGQGFLYSEPLPAAAFERWAQAAAKVPRAENE